MTDLLYRPFVNRLGIRPGFSPDQLKQIACEVADRNGISYAQMVGLQRSRLIAWARQEAYWECSRRTGASLPQIGRVFSRDHSSVLYGIREHEKRAGIVPELRK